LSYHLLYSALSIGITANNKKPPLEEAVLLLDSWFFYYLAKTVQKRMANRDVANLFFI